MMRHLPDWVGQRMDNHLAVPYRPAVDLLDDACVPTARQLAVLIRPLVVPADELRVANRARWVAGNGFTANKGVPAVIPGAAMEHAYCHGTAPACGWSSPRVRLRWLPLPLPL